MTSSIMTRSSWLKKRLVQNDLLADTRKALSQGCINTVCASAVCPNQNECFSSGRATFLLLGDICTRNCAFCAVKKGVPSAPDAEEPSRIARSVKELGLKYVVLTSVTRDDLADGGAGRFADAVKAVRGRSDGIRVEVLTPDFGGNKKAVEIVVRSLPDVFGHNIETVERLYESARRGAGYHRSLELLRDVKKLNSAQLTKSSIMVGLGETSEEIAAAMEDLRGAGCDILTIGQYLRPRQENAPVARYVMPGEFQQYKEAADAIGFKYVAAGPFVRSSYMAEEAYLAAIHKEEV